MNLKNVMLNISYSISSNLLSLVVSALVTLFLPKILGVNFYGYFQLYLFYTTFVGFLHFGCCDGIYLKYGGNDYDDLDKSLFKGQYLLLLFSQIVITLIFLILIFLSDIQETEKSIVFLATAFNVVALNIRTFSTFLLQATNRIKDCSFVTILDRLIYIVLVIILLIFKVNEFYWYIVADLIGKYVSMIVSLVYIKEISKITVSTKIDFFEMWDSIKIGSNLMFANIASSLIVGIIRFGIQKEWDVETFGKISLTLSISNLILVFVNAVSLVIFPLLKKQSKDNYSMVYFVIRTFVMPIILFLLLLYYPLNTILIRWIPLYEDALKYMAIVFPILIFECKVSLLTNTYLKALRKEKVIFIVNFLSAILSLICTFIFVFILKNLILTMLSIVFVLAFKSSLAEAMLSKSLDIKVYKDIMLEYLVVGIFIFVSWNFNTLEAMVVYIIIFLIYLLFKVKDIQKAKIMLKNL
ncbi:oligosaccharide flippase family protein [Vagococcus fluvialis]|uniref:oligosaccharide flippase family protein n=1 Tax=Vagococcus fluvialis TaxID=2738 RepID=UPI001A8ED095|nr:oligosaccharide flippase family protein [Vagococcus fluvialis]MBO0437910.1 oligosaccharide flippase family protein [Vagococcus fluvialis]